MPPLIRSLIVANAALFLAKVALDPGITAAFGLWPAGITQLLVVSVPPVADPYPTVGASGGVFGVLLAFAMRYPRRRVTLIFPPVPMPAWLFVTLYGAAELLQGVTGTASGVAHFAHLGGMAGAWLVLRRWRRSTVE